MEGTAASDALIEQAMAALEFDEQVELVHRWQRENATRMPAVPATAPRGMRTFSLNWPWAKNVGTYRDFLSNPPQTIYPHWWLDEKKRQEVMG